MDLIIDQPHMDELQNMERKVVTFIDDEPSPGECQRWMDVLKFHSIAEASAAIKEYRADFAKLDVQARWQEEKEELGPLGWNEESYGYSLFQVAKAAKLEAVRREVSERKTAERETAERETAEQEVGKRRAPKRSEGRWLFKLDGPLYTVELVQKAGNMQDISVLEEGTGESGQADFCVVDGKTKDQIRDWLAAEGFHFNPTFIIIPEVSRKELDSQSIAPCIGKDATLPQYRLENAASAPVPLQDQYPVWYFFYGKLAEAERLTRLLSLNDSPVYIKAFVEGATIRVTRDSGYNALIDSPGSCAYGYAYLVISKAHEDSLRYFETDCYEVVRCEINAIPSSTSDSEMLEDCETGEFRVEKNGSTTAVSVVPALCFRFAGTEENLVPTV